MKTDASSSSPSLFVFAIGLVFLALNFWYFSQALLLQRSGVQTQAVVTRTAIQRHKGGVSYTADYHFTVSGRPFDGSGGISPQSYVKLRPGEPIAVRYAQSNPSISETAEMSHNITTLALTGLMGFPVSLFILVLAFRKPPTQRVNPRADGTESVNAEVALEEFYALKDLVVRDGRLALEVANLDAGLKAMRAKGVRVLREPSADDGARIAVIADAKGNAVVIYEKI